MHLLWYYPLIHVLYFRCERCAALRFAPQRSTATVNRFDSCQYPQRILLAIPTAPKPARQRKHGTELRYQKALAYFLSHSTSYGRNQAQVGAAGLCGHGGAQVGFRWQHCTLQRTEAVWSAAVHAVVGGVHCAATCRASLRHYKCAGCAVPAASWRWSAACTRCAGSRVCRSCEGKPYYCAHCSAQASGCAAAWWALSPEYPPTEGYARVLTGTRHRADSRLGQCAGWAERHPTDAVPGLMRRGQRT